MPTPIHSVYEPLYLNDDKFIVLITGGRGSGKSYEVSRYIERLTFEQGQKILFSRYTMTSADKSIIPEVLEKIQGDGTADFFNIKQDRIQNLRTQSEIIFMGIKASSGNQTAKLKSIQGLSTFVVDEAEEWVSPDEYEKLVLSLRQKGVKNTVIIVMNPSDTSHFIYQKYLKDTHRIVDYLGVPIQISTHPQVLHIHTTYQDNLRNLAPEFISTVEELRESNPEKFAHVVAGQWSNQKKGLIFPHYEVIDELPHFLSQRAIGLDFGYTNDPSAAVLCGVHGDDLYLHELFYKRAMGYQDLIDALQRATEYDDLFVFADSAEPREIAEIYKGSRAQGKGINIFPVKKGAGSILAGLQKMQDLNIKVTRSSKNLRYELENYSWELDPLGEPTNKPIDRDNHAIDATRYYVWGQLFGQRKVERQCWTGI
ncbi:PBSX family phage terminase large subunit [uncultured Porphyromonas sp.]|uniref:PBSX family phage terminase large subunit n=1 Tax=uncultured Porphyromonas sp. TaxID=159274 RepID=UPI002596B7FC|nr:PBSX family phage terminase large subunit [uncultured Porphyromonas sp.]